MNQKLIVYLKPTCSKCRSVVKILKDRGVEFAAINYYERPFTEEDLRRLLRKLALSPRDILRKDEPVARQLGVAKKNLSEEQLIALMVTHPDLIQRPVIVRGDEAVLGRPPENVERLL
jgi:arsenate reductase (glutaredoxin)